MRQIHRFRSVQVTKIIANSLIKSCLSYLFFAICILLSACNGSAADTSWPEVKLETKPGMRWWWLGSAVDSAGLTVEMERLHHAGVGAVEITPIYGITGAEHRHIDYLSPRWMNMYKHVHAEGKRLGILIDIATGTGWPFGGPTVSIEDAASKVIFQKYQVEGGSRFSRKIIADDPNQSDVAKIATVMAYSEQGEKLDLTGSITADNMLHWDAPAGNWTVWAVFDGKTLQEVKRSAPGGEGWVVDHFSADALQRYFTWFDDAFKASGAPLPNSFFNDSYEIFGADWVNNFFPEFEKRRGYRLQDYIPELNREGSPDIISRVIFDYRQTIGDLLMDEFTIPWVKWVHSHGSTARNQAHGSPGNLIDYYAVADIPECESFGWTIFDIPGLRMDSIYRVSSSHPGIMKFSSSAANLTGKPFVSSETFTWLTEHFRTSLSQMKPMLDQMFVAGVNHIYYHGIPYSPDDVAWPGWLFYASVNMNHNNTIFKDVRGLNDYITRSQSFLQYGKSDNDFLVYYPLINFWQIRGGRHQIFRIHDFVSYMPAFFDMILKIKENGFDSDYISDNFLLETNVKNGMIQTGGAAYKAIIIPDVKYIPVEILAKIAQLAKDGATVIFTNRMPDDVPGLSQFEQRRAELNNILEELPVVNDFGKIESKPFGKGKIISGSELSGLLSATNVKAEELPVIHGAQILRRKHEQGYHYFIAMLQNRQIDGWVQLAVDAKSAVIYNTLTGKIGKANIRKRNGNTEIYLQIEPGQSLVVKTFTNQTNNMHEYAFYKKGAPIIIDGDWTFRFTEGMPAIDGEYSMKGSPVSWTELAHDSVKVYAGTGRYSITFDLTENADNWLLDLGALCESARVRINGKDAGIVWSLPFTLQIGEYLTKGQNHIEIDVTNLPANRIRDYDRRGVNWRIFKEINFVNLRYSGGRYDHWDIMPSGLTSPVAIVPLFSDVFGN